MAPLTYIHDMIIQKGKHESHFFLDAETIHKYIHSQSVIFTVYLIKLHAQWSKSQQSERSGEDKSMAEITM